MAVSKDLNIVNFQKKIWTRITNFFFLSNRSYSDATTLANPARPSAESGTTTSTALAILKRSSGSATRTSTCSPTPTTTCSESNSRTSMVTEGKKMKCRNVLLLQHLQKKASSPEAQNTKWLDNFSIYKNV